jgi:hypothetical protein
MTYRVEAAVLSNEELYLQPGGEPIVWVVMRDGVCTSDDPTNHQGDTCPVHEDPDPIAVFFDEQSAHDWVHTMTAPDRAVADIRLLLDTP